MKETLIKEEYPFLEESDIKKITSFISGKCSQYYFIDYLRCSNANVDDVIEFYLLDDKLR